MKLLVFSDSHGRTARVRTLLRLHRDADCAVFLGDGLSDVEDAMRDAPMPLWSVRGNCDAFPPLWEATPTDAVMEAEGHRLYLCHGHLLGVKGGMGGLIKRAGEYNCDIALFGHTHEAYETYVADAVPPLYLFNPGSLGHPRDGEPSYGLLLLKDNAVLFSNGKLTD